MLKNKKYIALFIFFYYNKKTIYKFIINAKINIKLYQKVNINYLNQIYL